MHPRSPSSGRNRPHHAQVVQNLSRRANASPDFDSLSQLSEHDVGRQPVDVDRVVDVDQRKGAHFAPPHPRHEEEPRDHGSSNSSIQVSPSVASRCLSRP